MKQIEVAIAVVHHDQRILICKRGQQGPLAGYWEFPGGKREVDETIEECLKRELREELEISVLPVLAMECLEHTYPHAQVMLHPFICRLQAGQPRPVACEECRWVALKDLHHYSFPPANDELIPRIIALLSQNGSGDGI